MDGETILCISTRRWDSLWRSTQQIMSRIAARNRVIYFEPGRNPDKPVISEFRRNFLNFFRMEINEMHKNVFVVQTPSSLPHARQFLPRSTLRITMPMLTKINAWIEMLQVRRAVNELKIESPILWLFSPYQIDFIGKFGEKFTCYHNYDEFSGFTQNSHIFEWLRNQDEELCRRVDVIFTTSRSQWERRKPFNANTYFIPNGVDFGLFNKALSSETPIPADIANLQKPIIGYTGWLGYQMDIDLLLGIAEAYTDCSLVLIGPDAISSNEKYHRLQAMPNVHFLGQKALERLPEYLKAIDVALIPYLLEGYVLTAYPLKLHEYLAAGRAIVSTALPELRPYSHVVRIANTHTEFISQIREALLDHSMQAVEARVAVARENTWDNRVADMFLILQPIWSKANEPVTLNAN